MKVVFKSPWLAVFCGALALLTILLVPGCTPEELGAGHPTTPDYYDQNFWAKKEPRMWVIPKSQTAEEVQKKSAGCMSCHKGIENPSMHESPAVKIGCTDCHGGDATATTKECAHVHARGHWYHLTQPYKTKVKTMVKEEEGEKKDEKADQDGNKEENKTSSADTRGEFAPINVTAGMPGDKVQTGDETRPAEGHGDKKEDEHGEGHAEIHEGGHGGVGYYDLHGGHGHGEHAESAGGPQDSWTAWIQESPEFVRFINPGDLRVARYTCGECHEKEVKAVPTSMMSHGAMLWGAALYNNGAHNQKYARYGEAYTFDGQPGRLQTLPRPTIEETRTRGVLPFLDPLQRYNTTQPGNVLRAFERGGRIKLETAQQDPFNEPGKPEFKLSTRSTGTVSATDPVFLGIQKTRLFNPTLWMPGTNDQAGDYRQSGCTACHTPYANDRDPAHSGPYAKYGKWGQSFTKDEAMKDIVGIESGHPIKHVFTKVIPSSQCVVCHMHPGTTVTNTYFGTLWWDLETNGSLMYPKTQKPIKSEDRRYEIKVRNVEGSALRGLWGDVNFLEQTYEMNKQFTQMQVADFNGHGWIFRNIYKHDRKGNLLDKDNNIVPFDSPTKFAKGPKGEPIAGAAVHLQDIHQEKGMHCIDCHFAQDNHGNGKLYGEVRNATEIMCADCHGTIYTKATLKSSGNAAPDGGTDLTSYSTAFGKRFKWVGDKLIQQSATDPNLKWEVPQTIDTITPGMPNYNERSRLAKTMRKDGKTWGDVPADKKELAHQDERMDCYVCHTSWTASCFGCHLPMRANQARFNNYYEGGKSRNWTQYNFQTLRDDIFFLGIDGTAKKNKVAPVRSMCAVIVSSQTAGAREWIYSQQQTISAEGFSGQSFSPHFPHSVRTKETKQCTDCHLSANGDNNAWLAQVYLQGTNQTNFMYRILYAGSDDGGLHAITVTEREEPQAVIGSTLHRDAYPEEYAKHLARGRELEEVYTQPGDVLNLQLRGEYVYTARGNHGMTVYDVANVDNKGFSDRIITAPVSPLGQRLYVPMKDCRAVLSPTVLGVDPTRQPPLRPRDPLNQEQPIALTYAFLYCLDHEEGLVTTLAGTLLDGDPTNNYLHRHLTFNPNNILKGAVNGQVCGNYLYVCCDAGLVVVDISKIGTELAVAAIKLNPDGTKVVSLKDLAKCAEKASPDTLKVVATVPLNKPKAVRIQFRYAFVIDCDGLKVIDVTDPTCATLVQGALVPFKDAHNVYLSRTNAIVAAGSEGIGFVDIEKPAAPKLTEMYTADGKLCDVRDVKVGMTNASMFAYVANGRQGLAVLQLFSPESVPQYLGWSPPYKPTLIATKKLPGCTVCINEGLQRDRGVDESGNQLSVFGRVGSRPLNKAETQRMYLRDGKIWTVTNEAPGAPLEIKAAGGIDPELKKKIDELEEQVKSEKNPAKRRKLQAELDELKKKAEESGGGKGEKIKELEEAIKSEKNPAKKKKLQAELEELKK